jgi:hypothetical protein
MPGKDRVAFVTREKRRSTLAPYLGERNTFFVIYFVQSLTFYNLKLEHCILLSIITMEGARSLLSNAPNLVRQQ